MTMAPAIVMGLRSEVLAWNHLGHALVAGHYDYDSPANPAARSPPEPDPYAVP